MVIFCSKSPLQRFPSLEELDKSLEVMARLRKVIWCFHQCTAHWAIANLISPKQANNKTPEPQKPTRTNQKKHEGAHKKVKVKKQETFGTDGFRGDAGGAALLSL